MENTKSHEMKGGKKTDYEFVFQIALIGILVLLLVYNAGKVYGRDSGVIVNEVNGINGNAVASNVVPKGTPALYGEELKVKYDDVSASNPKLADATIQKLSSYEDKSLNTEQMTRYIKVAGSISCEYCCGAQSIIFSNGERACGCAHSFAMRGIAKYLIIEHPDMSDEDILRELGKWKVLFFPGIHSKKHRY